MRLLVLFACTISLPVNIALAEPVAVAKAALSVSRTLAPKQPPEIVPAWVPASPGLNRPQALRHLRGKGFTVSKLMQDSEGIWLGEVTQKSQIIDVAVDLEGNVITW